MTVRELIDELSKHPPDAKVYFKDKIEDVTDQIRAVEFDEVGDPYFVPPRTVILSSKPGS